MTADEAKAGMTETQSLRLDCALNLHGFAESVIAINRGEPKDDEDRIRRLCTAGAIAESYVANMRQLNDLLRCKLDRNKVSDEETVAAWGEQYEWIVRNGLRRPIRRWNGVTLVRLPFADIHAIVMEQHRKVMQFRKEISK